MSAVGDAVIAVKDLTKRFPGVFAVEAMSFSVARGEIFGLVGPDGAGKTTLMRMCAGVMRPDSGAIFIDGIDVVRNPEDVKTRLSYMPQRFGLYEDLTVDENIRFYADLFEIGPDLRETRAAQLIAASGLGEFRTRRAGKLSGGMKQKLGLICALVHTPRVLLLDEPTTGVDPVSRRDFWHILYGLRESGVTIVISTAYLDEAERCTRLALLHAGRLRYCDTPQKLKQLMPGVLVKIRSTEPRAARDVLSPMEGVSSTMLVGDGVHITVDESARRIPELRAALEAQNVPVGDITAIAPGIEDLFVGLFGSEADSS